MYCEGIEYDFNQDIWIFKNIRKSYSINFFDFYTILTSDILANFKKLISFYLSNYKVGTAYNYYNALSQFFKKSYKEFGLIDNIDRKLILFYYNELGNNSGAKGILKTPLLKWFDLGYQGVSSNAYDILKKIKLKHKVKGESVLTADPIKGPYTSSELSSTLIEIESLFQNKKLSLESFTLSYLYHCLGLRTIQICLLKVKDYIVENHGGAIRYYLNVPRVKQNLPYDRAEFSKFEIVSELSSIIEFWLNTVKNEYIALNISMQFEEMPIFPDWLQTHERDLIYHQETESLRLKYIDISIKFSSISERTGEKIHLTPRRARKTFATRAAIEGKNANTIAVLLDHSSTESVKHYVTFARDIATEIEQSIGKDILPLIMAFRGEIISDAPIAGTKQRIRNNNPFHADAGICVNRSGCGVYSKDGDIKTILPRIPFCCYTCPFFNAWDDIEVHEEHLFFLQNEQTKILKGYQDDGHPQNHLMCDSLSLTIKAISEVILLIESDKVKNTIDPETI